jgi:hypothetical protein
MSDWNYYDIDGDGFDVIDDLSEEALDDAFMESLEKQDCKDAKESTHLNENSS